MDPKIYKVQIETKFWIRALTFVLCLVPILLLGALSPQKKLGGDPLASAAAVGAIGLIALCVGYIGHRKRKSLRIQVDDSGITKLSPKNEPIHFVAWNEIAGITQLDRRLLLRTTDANGNKLIDLDYRLENFDAIRERVESHITTRAKDGQGAQKT